MGYSGITSITGLTGLHEGIHRACIPCIGSRDFYRLHSLLLCFLVHGWDSIHKI